MKTATIGLMVASLTIGACSSTGSDDSAGGDGDISGGDGDGDLVGDGDGDIVGDGDGAGGQIGDGDTGGVFGDGDTSFSQPPPTCDPGLAATSQIARLKNAQYDNTIRDLLGLTTLSDSNGVLPSSLLESDHTGSMTELGWSSYKTVAEKIAAQVMGDATLKAKFLLCDEASEGCLSSTIAEFGRRAFRRPLSDVELSAFETLVASGPTTTPTGAASEVAELLLFGFLVSAPFIVRAEMHEDTMDAEGNYLLSSHEVASRLSYLLWGSMPDADLRAAADADELQTREQIFVQAQRLLTHDNARQRIAAFHRSYLLMAENTRWDSADHDSALFPEFNSGQVLPMAEETEAFFDYVTFSDGSFQDLLLDTTGFVNAETAALYGLDAVGFGESLTQTDLNAEERPGFLTRLGFLSSYSGYARTSPILRGAYIIQDVLGIEIGAPPPGAADEPLPDLTEDLDTNRKQVDAQTAGIACAECHHTYVNPAGFAMENYDAIGRFRVAESSGVPIDAVADVIIDNDEAVTVTRPLDLMTAIANSQGAQRYYVEKWVSFAYERVSNEFDDCTVDDISAKVTSDGYSILQLVTDLTLSKSFSARVVAQ